MKNIRGNKAITLIALIITIIIILILVSVTVSIALNGGLFGTAKESAKRTEKNVILEDIISMAEIEKEGKINKDKTFKNVKNKYDVEGNVDELYIKGKYGKYRYKITEIEIISLDNKEKQGYPCVIDNSPGTELIGYKIYGNSVSKMLPSEYQQVEYIESTGTQYIDTNLKQTDVDGFYQKLCKNNKADTPVWGCVDNGNRLYGAYVLNTSNYVGLGYGLFYYINKTTGNIERSSPQNYWSVQTLNQYIETWFNYLGSDKLIHLTQNGEQIVSSNKVSTLSYNSGNSRNIILFGWMTATGSIGKANNCKIYALKLSKNNTLVADYIPCYRKSDNVIGMYDLVEDKFYTNQGEGTFVKGSDVVSTSEVPIKIDSVGDLVTDKEDINYGKYKIPVKVSNGKDEKITNIYLDKPLRKVENYTDYIDFEKQIVVYNGVEAKIELPSIKILKGENTITTETKVPASEIYCKYESY